MGVYVKGMDMPYDCEHCDFNMGYYCKRQWDDETYLIRFESNLDKRNNCPLVAVKAPHGDLIDRDALLFDNSEAFHDIDWYTNTAWEAVDNAPTVIESEGKEDG